MSEHIAPRNPVKTRVCSTRHYATQKDKAAVTLAQRIDIRKAVHGIRVDEHEKIAAVAREKQISVTRVKKELGYVSSLEKKTCSLLMLMASPDLTAGATRITAPDVAQSAEYKAEYRAMPEEQLTEIVAKHEAWREREKLGKRTRSKEQSADIVGAQKRIKDTLAREFYVYLQSGVVLNNTEQLEIRRAAVRKQIDEGLAKVMLHPCRMEYSRYQELMVARHGVILKGYPLPGDPVNPDAIVSLKALDKILAAFKSAQDTQRCGHTQEGVGGG
ncbi:hypothetical protein BOTBODRAFT_42025 [Botryobasidium botryosum FD-172 SS1]|uniref:Uncharacterized protein n=1 Tax=Botryobasidium botryosum (strain FD-172 SS1) TaxID=930990 RepID=A0A067N5R5_BOTB1|nr:hypothetical protein BOTBODRAFT_42025 [Botryobasidium botryosum FD-172 SS1]